MSSLANLAVGARDHSAACTFYLPVVGGQDFVLTTHGRASPGGLLASRAGVSGLASLRLISDAGRRKLFSSLGKDFTRRRPKCLVTADSLVDGKSLAAPVGALKPLMRSLPGARWRSRSRNNNEREKAKAHEADRGKKMKRK